MRRWCRCTCPRRSFALLMRLLAPWIRDVRSVDERERRQRMRSHLRIARDLERVDSAREQCVRDQQTMAAPGNGLRAHERHALDAGELEASFETALERRRLHIVGIAAKTLVMP